MITQIPRAAAVMAGPTGGAGSDGDRVVLRDGSTIAVRSLATGDVAAIAAWFEALGPETRHARFLGSVAMLDDRTRWQLAQVDHRDHEALTAVTPDGAVVGIARYIRLPQSSAAEVAVAVADHWRGRGIASLLLQEIAARARAAGIDRLTALCLASNTAVLGLLSRLGPITATPPDAEVIEVRIDLGRAPTAARR
jgi:GNAT superfamily N-acetyltransferase